MYWSMYISTAPYRPYSICLWLWHACLSQVLLQPMTKCATQCPTDSQLRLVPSRLWRCRHPDPANRLGNWWTTERRSGSNPWLWSCALDTTKLVALQCVVTHLPQMYIHRHQAWQEKNTKQTKFMNCHPESCWKNRILPTLRVILECQDSTLISFKASN